MTARDSQIAMFSGNYEQQLRSELRAAESMERQWRAETERLHLQIKALRYLQSQEAGNEG